MSSGNLWRNNTFVSCNAGEQMSLSRPTKTHNILPNQDAKQTLEKANVSREVYKNLLQSIRRSCNIDRVPYDIPCEAAEVAAENQEILGNDTIPKGFLIHQWTDAIESLW